MTDKPILSSHIVKSLKVELELKDNGGLILNHTFYPSCTFDNNSPKQPHTLVCFTVGPPTSADEWGMVSTMNLIRKTMSQESFELWEKYKDRFYDVNCANEIDPKSHGFMSKEQLLALWEVGTGCHVTAALAAGSIDRKKTPTEIDTTGTGGFLGYSVQDFDPKDEVEINERARLREILHHLMFYKIPEGTLKFIQPSWVQFPFLR